MCIIEVIEEDFSIRTLLAEWLTDEGFRVGSGAALPSAPGVEVGVAVVGLRGDEAQIAGAIGRARAAYPNAALIGLSGQLLRVLGAASRKARELGVAALVPKPCSRAEMVAVVRSVLAQRR